MEIVNAKYDKDAGAVVLLSGGLDSTVCLYTMCSLLAGPVVALSVLYGQRHRRELEYAKKITAQLSPRVEHIVVDLEGLRVVMGGSSQTSDEIAVPHGHYEEESMKQTVVPNRNMVLLSVATALAVSRKIANVAYAAHAGDHAIYPDCRPQFAMAMAGVMSVCDWHKVALWPPFIQLTKAQIVAMGAKLGVPFALTYSCYEGGESHCGQCGTCTERKMAFAEAGVFDPTPYTPQFT